MELPPFLRRKPDDDNESMEQPGKAVDALESGIADSDNPIVTAWHLRAQRRKFNRWRIWLVPATIAAGLLALPAVYSQYVSVPITPPIQLVCALWAIVLPLAVGWLLFGLYDACLSALELLTPPAERSGRAPTDETLGLTALSNSEILLAGLRLTLLPLIPRVIALGIAVWAALTAANWVWGLEAYGQYGGSYWLHGTRTTAYADSYYWDIVSRLLVTAPLIIARVTINTLLPCTFIVLSMICAGRLGMPAQLRGLAAAIITLVQPMWSSLLLLLLYVPDLPAGIGLVMALLPPAITAVVIVAFWLAIITRTPAGHSYGIWLGIMLLALTLTCLAALMVVYGVSAIGSYIFAFLANYFWAFSSLAVLNPCNLPPEAYAWLLEDYYFNYGYRPGSNSPFLLGMGPWLLLSVIQLGLTAIGLAFAREGVRRWRQGGE